MMEKLMKNLLTNANYGKSLNEISHIRQTSFNDLYNLIMEHAIMKRDELQLVERQSEI